MRLYSRKIDYHWGLILMASTLLLVCISGCADKNENSMGASPPNILVIIADDAGWNDVGYNGSEINTPNIDDLANNGVRLDRFYVNPTCSPSRASFLTGRPASRMGIVGPISGRSEKSLSDTIATLPSLLREQNYQTALFGKWHLGLKPSSGPKAYGFDYSYGFLHGQIDQYTHKYKNGDSSWHRNGELITEEGHATDLIGKETVEWLTTKRDTAKSFYIQLAYSAPHFPLQEEEQWKRPYRSILKDSSRIDFAAAMTHMDHNIGQVFHTLKALHLQDNTLIIFMSDNGAMRNWYPKDQYDGAHGPNPTLGSNAPLRDWKTSNFEGGIRVPAFVYWKDSLKPKTVKNYISIMDWMPTLLNLSGSKKVPKTVEGQNIWEAVTGPGTLSQKPMYVRGHLQESIIQKPWKLIRTRHTTADTELELYNIETDPEERKDRYASDTDRAQKLLGMLEYEFQKDAPTVNADIH